MKLKTSILSGLMALALLFSFGAVHEAKASEDDLGFTFDVFMGNGSKVIDGKPGCALFDKNGKEIGTVTADLSDYPNKVTMTFSTNTGTLVVEEWAGDSITIPTGDGMALSAGEYIHIVSATGTMKSVTSVLHRCLYAIDANGVPTKCINCLYALIRE